MSTSNSRTKSPRGRLHLRLAQREIAEIQNAVKATGATSPAALILNLVRQQAQTDGLIVGIERQLQAVVDVAVGAAVAQLGDRLAADLAAISTAVAAVSGAVEDRPSKAQLSGFIEHALKRAMVGGASMPTAVGTATPGATAAP